VCLGELIRALPGSPARALLDQCVAAVWFARDVERRLRLLELSLRDEIGVCCASSLVRVSARALIAEARACTGRPEPTTFRRWPLQIRLVDRGIDLEQNCPSGRAQAVSA